MTSGYDYDNDPIFDPTDEPALAVSPTIWRAALICLAAFAIVLVVTHWAKLLTTP